MNFDKYESNIDFPNLINITNEIKDELDNERCTRSEYEARLKEVKIEADIVYKQKMLEYRQEESRLRQQFFNDVFIELGLDVLPHDVLDQFNTYVWDQGHSSGYYDVYNVACDISDLVLTAYNAGRKNI